MFSIYNSKCLIYYGRMEQRTMIIDGKAYFLIPAENVPVGSTYITETLGISRATLSRSPWHYPDFGVRMRGHKRIKPYGKLEVDSWLTIPAKVRRERYYEWRRSNEADKQNGIA